MAVATRTRGKRVPLGEPWPPARDVHDVFSELRSESAGAPPRSLLRRNAYVSRDGDLFASINYVKFSAAMRLIEIQIDTLFSHRHAYPIWPAHSYPLDEYEREYHTKLRHSYYASVETLIEVLRRLREIA